MSDTADVSLLSGSVVVTVPIARKRISDLLCSAVEGGTGYWARVDNIERTPALDYVSARFTEAEASCSDDKRKRRTIDITKLANGIARCAASNTYAHHFAAFMKEDDDAITADVMVQFAMFGDVIYG
jgi:hypothetical protein